MDRHNPIIALLLLVIVFVGAAALLPQQADTTFVTPGKEAPVYIGPGKSGEVRKAPWAERECHDYTHCANSVLPFGDANMYWFPTENSNPEYNVCAIYVDAPQKVVLDYYQSQGAVQMIYWYGSSVRACKQLLNEVQPLDQMPE